LAAALCAPLLGACVTHNHHHPAHSTVTHRQVYDPGPPPHAPAHGYRHKHRDRDGGVVVDLEYDKKLSVYVVLGNPGHYFHSGHYYRQKNGRWTVSPRVGGPWTVVEVVKLPPGLRGKHKQAKKTKTPGPWKTAPPAKHKKNHW
jgi:hypothetical protein